MNFIEEFLNKHEYKILWFWIIFMAVLVWAMFFEPSWFSSGSDCIAGGSAGNFCI